MILFQFTPLREGRRTAKIRLSGTSTFQFTPLREGRHDPPKVLGASIEVFQFTPLREGRPEINGNRGHGIHFNSRPSARGDGLNSPLLSTVSISIHAPPRGATLCRDENERRKYISIHAPPRGATSARTPGRSREPISIHAPPRGATRRKSSTESKVSGIFQFTPLREGRPEQEEKEER